MVSNRCSHEQTYCLQQSFANHCSIRHGDTGDQLFNCCIAQTVDLSLWQSVQGLGILYLSVIVGLINRKVWLRTFTSAIVCSIRGM